VRFEVSNPLAQAAIDLVFADLVERQIHAFEDRCYAVYGGGKNGRT
jgi:ribosome-associated toxin RatA of RatAB toxin-antitoxin module